MPIKEPAIKKTIENITPVPKNVKAFFDHFIDDLLSNDSRMADVIQHRLHFDVNLQYTCREIGSRKNLSTTLQLISSNSQNQGSFGSCTISFEEKNKEIAVNAELNIEYNLTDMAYKLGKKMGKIPSPADWNEFLTGFLLPSLKNEEERQQREADDFRQQQASMEPARLEKLKKLVRVSERLKIAQMAQILKLEEKDLYDRIVDWADQFGFTIDEDVVKFSTGRKDDFIAALDGAFAGWEDKEKNKDGKLE